MARLLTAAGPARRIACAVDALGFTLDEVYRLLDCQTVEQVSLGEGLVLLIDEDGKRRQLPVNVEATRLLRVAGSLPDDFVVGDALIARLDEGLWR